MAERIDEARIIAWIDGELTSAEGTAIEAAVAENAELSILADRHRRMKARFAAAFAPIAAEPEEPRRSAPILSLAATRAERKARHHTAPPTPSPVSRWAWPVGIAASLLLGVAVGRQVTSPAGVGDRPGALALDRKIATALDSQLSGDTGPVRVALSFRDRQGAYCRSFTGASLSGVACRAGAGWALRYGAPGQPASSTYRTAGTDEETMAAIDSMIVGDPLDRMQESTARYAGWRSDESKRP